MPVVPTVLVAGELVRAKAVANAPVSRLVQITYTFGSSLVADPVVAAVVTVARHWTEYIPAPLVPTEKIVQ